MSWNNEVIFRKRSDLSLRWCSKYVVLYVISKSTCNVLDTFSKDATDTRRRCRRISSRSFPTSKPIKSWHRSSCAFDGILACILKSIENASRTLHEDLDTYRTSSQWQIRPLLECRFIISRHREMLNATASLRVLVDGHSATHQPLHDVLLMKFGFTPNTARGVSCTFFETVLLSSRIDVDASSIAVLCQHAEAFLTRNAPFIGHIRVLYFY